MKNYILIYYAIFLILFNNISAMNDLEKVPLPDYVSSAFSTIAVLVICKLESHTERVLGFLFGKYLFIIKPKLDNNKIKSIEKIQKFDFVDNKLILQTFPASSFIFGETPTENNDLYVTLIERAPFKLEEHPNYEQYFESILSKDEFLHSLEDVKNEYYFIYFTKSTNKVLWEQYSSTEIESYIFPPLLKRSTTNFVDYIEPLLGVSPEPTIFFKLPPYENRGIFVLCKGQTHCYIAKLSLNEESIVVVYFINKELNPYKNLLINRRLKVD